MHRSTSRSGPRFPVGHTSRVRVETLLPLGKVDPGLRAPATPFDISTVADQARLVEALGYDRLVFEETKDDPFVVLAAAA